MKKRLANKGSFAAHDADGNQYTIDRRVTATIGHSNVGIGRTDSPEDLKTSDGREVSREKKGVYFIHDPMFGNKIRVTSDDPDAP